MRNKILIEVYFPAIYISFDVYIPDDVSFYRITSMIKKVSDKITNGLFVPSDENVLCDMDTGLILDINQTARELCLHNGSKLMFI
ncbi:MAG: methyltransferase [Ruminiclostridium sp.]|nr:methyltransferase [Ruminiclostridium sp.]